MVINDVLKLLKIIKKYDLLVRDLNNEGYLGFRISG